MKKLTKRLWYGSDTEKDKDGNIIASAPPVAVDDGGEDWHLKGLTRGEIYLNDNIYDPSLFCLGSDGFVKKLGGGSGGNGGSVIVNIDITQGDGISINKNTVGKQLIYKVSHKDTSDVKSTSNTGMFIIDNLSFDDFGHVTRVSNINAANLFDDRYLRKDIDDTAHGSILFDKKIGSSIFLDGYDGKGWEITGPGAALLDSARVRSDIYMGGKFGSPSYAAGFTGWGVEIDIPTAAGTFDFLTVRKSMKVYELVYSQIYGLGGSVIISDLNKILYVETCQGFYRCYMDSMDSTMRMNLRKDDIVRMQRSSGINIRYFYGEVLKVTPDYFDLKVTDGEDYPQLGDVVFRFGNKTDKNRQGIIYLTSSDDKAPYIDVLDGITDSSMLEKVKVRIGNVAGIRTKSGIQLEGYRIYAQGAVFEDSDIYLEDGTTVSQQFIVMNGKFSSAIEGIRNDMSLESGNILKNSSFGINLNYWKSTNDISFISVGGNFLWLDGSFYSEKRSVADIYRDGSKNVLRIQGTTIIQGNDVFTGNKTEGNYSFSFYCKVLRGGTLSAGFSGKELFVTESLPVSEEYEKISKIANWDGTGDFSIGFTGEILIYGVSLFNDALADATIKLQTQIDQTAEYIKLLATKVYVDGETGKVYTKFEASLTVMATEIAARVTKTDFDTATGAIRQEVSSQLSVQVGQITAISTDINNVKHTIDTAGWINSTQGNTLFAAKTLENGQRIINYINQTPGSTVISSNRINLYGAVTFSMFDPSLQGTMNGKLERENMGALAFKDYVESGQLSYDLANDIRDKIGSDALETMLKKYPQKGQVYKSDLVSDLQTEVSSAMKESVYVYGGFIKASFIDVDNLAATRLAAVRGTIGGFDIESDRIKSAYMRINPNTGINFEEDRNKFARIGADVLAPEGGISSQLMVCNSSFNRTESTRAIITVASFGIGASGFTNLPQTWIRCFHNNNVGWGSEFIVQSRYFGDSNSMERTCINVGALMTKGQLKAMTGQEPEEFVLKYDNRSKYAYI